MDEPTAGKIRTMAAESPGRLSDEECFRRAKARGQYQSIRRRTQASRAQRHQGYSWRWKVSAEVNVSEILVSARALLAKPGIWAQVGIPDGCYCAALAMWLYTPPGAGRVALNLFSAANGIRGFVSNWNDAPERTLSEVLAAFDRAIELAETRRRLQ